MLLLVEFECKEGRRTSWSFSGVHFTGILTADGSGIGKRGKLRKTEAAEGQVREKERGQRREMEEFVLSVVLPSPSEHTANSVIHCACLP